MRRLLLSLVCLTAASLPAGAQSLLSVDPEWMSDQTPTTRSLAVGDLDRDGDLDLVLGNRTAGSTVYPGSGGSFEGSPGLVLSAPAVAQAVGDVNGDGRLDIVVGDIGQNAVYLNTGAAFGAPVLFGRSSNTVCLALADLDNDGDLDLVCGNDGEPNTVYLNQGGMFEDTPAWTGSSDTTRAVVVGYVDGDSLLDVVFGNDSGHDVLYLNAGGLPGAAVPFGPANPRTQSMALGDMDGDGDLDLVCGNRGEKNALYRNDGGTFILRQEFGAQTELTRAVALGDVDGDGDLDVACGNGDFPPAGAPQANTLYLGAGDSLTVTPAWTSHPAARTSSVALADVDGDGDLDLVCGNDGGNAVVYRNLRPPFPAVPRLFPLNQSTNDIALGDMDGDGDLDMVLANTGPNRIYFFRDSTYDAAGYLDLSDTDDSRSVALGDVDGDGDLDLVFGNTGVNTLYLTEGGVPSSTPDWMSIPDLATSSVALGDVNGDGRIDLVTGNSGSSTLPGFGGAENYVYLNMGGTFASAPSETLASDVTWAVALADVNGDGWLDVVCGNDDQNVLYLNRSGSFPGASDLFPSTPSWHSPDSRRTDDIALADLDGDGHPDLICANGNGTESETIYFADGQGMFNPPREFAAGQETRGVAVGDVDRNGTLDMAFGNYSQPNTVYQDPASPTRLWLSSDTRRTNHLRLADVDGDGDLDLAAANGFFPFSTPAPDRSGWYPGLAAPVFPGDPAAPRRQLPNNGPFLRWVRADTTALDVNLRDVTFTAFDVEGDPVWVIGEYHYAGDPAEQWVSADLNGGVPGPVGPLAAPPAGAAHSLLWNIAALGFERRDVTLRLRIVDVPARNGLIQHVGTYSLDAGTVVPVRPAFYHGPQVTFPGAVTVGDTLFQALPVVNQGNTRLDLTVDLPDPAQMDTDHPSQFSLLSGQTDTLIVSLHPVVGGFNPGSLVVQSNDPLHLQESIPVEAQVLGLAFQARALTPTEPVPLGEAITVLVDPDPGVHVERGFLHYRAIGDSAFLFTPLSIETVDSTTGFAGTLVAGIPGSQVTEAGLEYYVSVENSGLSGTDPPGGPDSPKRLLVSPPAGFILNPAGDAFVSGNDVPIEVQLPTGALFQGGTLYFRRGGEDINAYRAVPFVDQSPFPLATIPGESVGLRGVEYWGEVQVRTGTLTEPPLPDPGVHPLIIQVTTGFEEEVSHPGKTYRMISVPLFMGENTVLDVLSGRLGLQSRFRWRMFLYAPARSCPFAPYCEIDSSTVFEQGRGYWIITRDDHRLGSGAVVGRTTPTDHYFSLALPDGYSMIGNPFAFPVSWDSVRVITTTDTLTTAQAEGENIEAPPLARVGDHYDSTAVLEPMKGYWVNNISGAPVTLEIPPRAAPASVASPLSRPSALGVQPRDGEWRVTITASSGGVTDRAVVGVLAGASEEWDRRDRSKMPLPPGEAVAVYLPRDRWPAHPDVYSLDFRGMPAPDPSGGGAAGHAWSFDVAKTFSRSDGGDAIALAFDGLDSLPGDVSAVLVDRGVGRTVDLRRESTLTFYAGVRGFVHEDEARFMLLVGSPDFVSSRPDLPGLPARTLLDPGYPNPFRRSMVARFEIARPTQGDLSVFDIRGARVRVLYRGDFEPGRFEIPWNGEDGFGRGAAPGVYFLRLKAGAVSRTQKLLKIR